MALVAGVVHAHELEIARLARQRQHRAARVALGEERVDHEVDVVPALLLIAVVGVDDLAARHRLHHAQREAAHLDGVALAQARALADAVGQGVQTLIRLQDRGVQQRLDGDARERRLPRLVVVALVAHDAQLVLDALAAVLHAVDAVEGVGDLGPAGDVLVGQKVGIVAADLVGEGAAELGRLHAPAPQLAVGAEERALVLGGAAHQVAVLPARPLLDVARVRRLDLQRVGVFAQALRLGRRRQTRARHHVEGQPDDDQRAEEWQPALHRAELHETLVTA